MFAAYLFLNTELGSESGVLEDLRKLEGVEEAHHLMGIYGIIANIKAETMEKLKSIITKSIGENKKITAKLTVLIRET
jgi:DNA-binding Lrp family transcriptional regulator